MSLPSCHTRSHSAPPSLTYISSSPLPSNSSFSRLPPPVDLHVSNIIENPLSEFGNNLVKITDLTASQVKDINKGNIVHIEAKQQVRYDVLVRRDGNGEGNEGQDETLKLNKRENNNNNNEHETQQVKEECGESICSVPSSSSYVSFSSPCSVSLKYGGSSSSLSDLDSDQNPTTTPPPSPSLLARGSILSTSPPAQSKTWWNKGSKKSLPFTSPSLDTDSDDGREGIFKATLTSTLRNMHFIPSSSSVLEQEETSPEVVDNSPTFHKCVNESCIMRVVVLPKGSLFMSFGAHSGCVIISSVRSDSPVRSMCGVGDVVVGIDEVGIGGREDLTLLVRTLREREGREGRLMRIISNKRLKG